MSQAFGGPSGYPRSGSFGEAGGGGGGGALGRNRLGSYNLSTSSISEGDPIDFRRTASMNSRFSMGDDSPPEFPSPEPAAGDMVARRSRRNSFVFSPTRTSIVVAGLVERLLVNAERPRRPSLPPSAANSRSNSGILGGRSRSNSGILGGRSRSNSGILGGRTSRTTSFRRDSFREEVLRGQPSGMMGPSRSQSSCFDGREIGARVMDRDGPFGQSQGHWELGTVGTYDTAKEAEIDDLIMHDWYHAFLDTKLYIQLLCFALAYMLGFCFFAVLFLLISKPCGLNLEGSFVRAYLLSLETMMTIGYGVPDPYMKGCWQAPVVLTAQTLLQLMMSACLVGVVFQGISRPQARACTIIFSDQAVIRCLDGAHYLMFRICDLRCRHSLVEAHVRCYCMRRHPHRGFELAPLRLEHPDDTLGGHLLLTLPTVVVHRIDAWSPLAPPPPSSGWGKRRRTTSASSAAQLNTSQQREHHRQAVWPGPLQRQVDCEAGNRTSCICPVCGEGFNTAEHLEMHCRYNAECDATSDLGPAVGHSALDPEQLQRLAHAEPTREELFDHLAHNFCEVVVLVEGIEATTSCTLQARHSYIVGGLGPANDVAWDMDFAKCVRVPQMHEDPAHATIDKGPGLALNLGRFHALAQPGPEQV